MKGEKKFGQTLLQQMYDQVPEGDKKIILERKKSSMSYNGKNVRIQCYIPKEIYTMLAYFGAFQTSESHFFTERAVEYLTERGLRIGAIIESKRGG